MFVHTDGDIDLLSSIFILHIDAVLARVLGSHPLNGQADVLGLLHLHREVLAEFNVFVVLKPDHLRIWVSKHCAGEVQGLRREDVGGKRQLGKVWERRNQVGMIKIHCIHVRNLPIIHFQRKEKATVLSVMPPGIC